LVGRAFSGVGFNSTLLRDFTAGNISTFEQLGIWLGFGLLIRGRLFDRSVGPGVRVSQFKFLPMGFLVAAPRHASAARVGNHSPWAGMAFVAIFALNLLMGAGTFHDYIVHFADPVNNFGQSRVINPSSLAFFRDLIDATSYTNGLRKMSPPGREFTCFISFLLALLLIRAVWNQRDRLRAADPKLLVISPARYSQ